MKKNLLTLLMLLFCVFAFSQTKQELDKVMFSKDPKEIADFIKKYPNNSNTSFLQRKLNSMKAPVATAATASTVSGTAKAPAQTADRDPRTQKKIDVLNHLFNNDPTKKDAYIVIKNQSECYLNVKIEGKKSFAMSVPSLGQNYILVPKGTYKVSTKICTALYSSTKVVDSDIEINLNAKKAGK